MARSSRKASVATAKPAAKAAAVKAPAHGADHGHLLERLLFLSDAVFAIVMTLLALELRLPEDVDDANLISGLIAMSPSLIAFATSFAVMSVFWMAHAQVTRELREFDKPVAAVNLVFLFTLALAPFITGMLGELGQAVNAWRVYCVMLMIIGAVQTALVVVICRGGGRLVGGLTPRQTWARLARAISPTLGFAIALAVSFAGYPIASRYAWVTIPLFLWAARLAFGPR